MFGAGLYFAKDSSKRSGESVNRSASTHCSCAACRFVHTHSYQYSLKHGSNVVLLCDVALGKPLQVDGADHEITYASLAKKKRQSVFAKGGTCVLYDEYVVCALQAAVAVARSHFPIVACIADKPEQATIRCELLCSSPAAGCVN